MPLPSETAAAPKHPCAICGLPATGTRWDVDLCELHNGMWFADPQFESGSVDAAIGMTKVRGVSLEWYPVHTPAQAKASAAEYRRRTLAWVELQRAESGRVTGLAGTSKRRVA